MAIIENEKLWGKIPYDVFINHIIPYTYQKIESNLLNDIQNFIHDYRIILNYYSFEWNEYFLIHDIFYFVVKEEYHCMKYQKIILLNSWIVILYSKNYH